VILDHITDDNNHDDHGKYLENIRVFNKEGDGGEKSQCCDLSV